MERRSLTFTEFSLFVPLLHLLFTVLSAPIVSAVPRNVTIDDQGGDPETGEIPKYQPTDAWANQACGGCRVVPDPERLYNRTATAATFMPDRNVTNNTIDFSFTGTAIYIFFTLFENEGDQITVNTECNFTIDGSYAGYFNHQGDPSKPFRSGQQYGVPVFSMRGLEQKNHSMTIYMADVDYHTFLSFDYATYTTDQELIVDPLRTSSSDVSRIARLSGTPSTASSTPSTGTRSHTPSVSGDTPTTTSNIPSMVTQNHPPVISVGAIAGSVVGGLVVITALISLACFYCQRAQRHRTLRPSPLPRYLAYVYRRSIDEETLGKIFSNPRNGHNPHPTQSTNSKSAPSTSRGSRTPTNSQSNYFRKTSERRTRAANQRIRSLHAEIASGGGRYRSS